MKKLISIACVTILLTMSGCSGNTYSKLRNREKQLIDSYIARQHIQVRNTMPAVRQGERWDDNLYVALPEYDQLYFHLTSPVDSTTSLVAGDKVNIRFRKYALTANADTISYWTTDDAGDPITLTVGPTTGNYNCTGWQAAILAMGYEGECKIICPSVYGPSADNASVTPYGYDLRITKKR